jgi:hypothetical protein
MAIEEKRADDAYTIMREHECYMKAAVRNVVPEVVDGRVQLPER